MSFKRVGSSVSSVLVLMACENLSAADSQLPACHVNVEKKVNFSDKKKLDTVQVKVDGNPCFQAKLVILVKNSKGQAIYQYEAPFKPHTAVDSQSTDLPKAAEDFARAAIDKGFSRRTGSLPVWAPKEKYELDNDMQVSVSEADYNRYRSLDLPIFWHFVTYDSFKEFVFDANKKKVVVLRTGGS